MTAVRRPLIVLIGLLTGALTIGRLALARDGSRSVESPAYRLALPWNWRPGIAQGGFCLLAALGDRLTGPLGKIAAVPRFLWNSNLAAVRGLLLVPRGRSTPMWDRVERREEPLEQAA